MVWDKDRFKRHAALHYEPPTANYPLVIQTADERLRTLLLGTPDWKTKDPAGLRVRRSLHFHENKRNRKSGRRRKVRSQRHVTDLLIGRVLLYHTNLQPKHRGGLTPYQIVSLSVAALMRKTRLSKSTVLDALARFEALGLLRTKRQKKETPEGLREITAVRWLTKTFFSALGLLRELAEQLDPYSAAKARRALRLAATRRPPIPAPCSPEPAPSPPPNTADPSRAAGRQALAALESLGLKRTKR